VCGAAGVRKEGERGGGDVALCCSRVGSDGSSVDPGRARCCLSAIWSDHKGVCTVVVTSTCCSLLGELVRCNVSKSHAHHETAACLAHLSRASSDCPPSITSPTDMTAATRGRSSTCAAR